MKSLTTTELRKLFLEFFRSKGHTVIPSASLIPENDPTVLFTTAGMHPLVPYLMGAAHPAGKRLTDVQKCVRTGDIDSVGDASHLTFFEMLGNWSLGDYFKKESIAWSWELLTDEKWLGIDKDRLYFTCFEGNENAPRDTYSMIAGSKWAWIPPISSISAQSITGGSPAQAAPAAPIPRYSSIRARKSAARAAILPAPAASILKSGITYSWNTSSPSTNRCVLSKRRT